MDNDKQRLFFALSPDDKSLESIVALQQQYNSKDGKWTKRENLHATLYFLGNISENDLDCVLAKVRQIKHQPFSLCFDKTGIFKRSGILWLGAQENTEDILLLYKKLCFALLECHFELEKRPYTPHITLARKFKGKPDINPFEPICFPVHKISLLASIPIIGGVEYHIVENISLT